MIVYLSTTDIAARLKVTHSAVSQMKRRGQLPEPDALIADRYGWKETTVVRWEAKRWAKALDTIQRIEANR